MPDKRSDELDIETKQDENHSEVITEKTIEDYKAELEKAKQIQEDKHNFALKSESEKKEALERLAKYENAERELEEKRLLEAWEFETLRNSFTSENELYKTQLEELTAQNEKYKAENESYLTKFESSILDKIPEDKREQAKLVVGAYTGQEKLTQLENLVKILWVTETSFWWKPVVGKQKATSRVDELKAKKAEWKIWSSEIIELNNLLLK